MGGSPFFGPGDYFWEYGPGVEQKRAADGITSFAYYTDATTARLVLEGEVVWMRSAKLLNDSSEIIFGMNLLQNVLCSRAADLLMSFLDSVQNGAAAILAEKLRAMQVSLLDSVFVTCVSAHSREENEIGRLSMWRAYGKANGVAIVIPKEVMLSWSRLPVYALPVRYGDEAFTEQNFKDILEWLMDADDIAGFGEAEPLVDLAVAAIQMQVVQSKHKAFAEEQEWRIFHLPDNPTFLSSIVSFGTTGLHRKDVEIGGVVQPIYELPILPALIPSSAEEPRIFPKPTLGDVIERILIGPSNTQEERRVEFTEILDRAGDPAAASKVITCDVPLRTQ